MEAVDSPWRTSSYSGTSGGECLETATRAGRVLVRDSKDTSGATLSLPAHAWRTFISHVRTGA